MSYLEKEEKKYLQKILQTRSKASRIQDLKDERDRVIQQILNGKRENETEKQERLLKAKSEYDQRQSRKLQQAYTSYVKLKQEREMDKKEKE